MHVYILFYITVLDFKVMQIKIKIRILFNHFLFLNIEMYIIYTIPHLATNSINDCRNGPGLLNEEYNVELNEELNVVTVKGDRGSPGSLALIIAFSYMSICCVPGIIHGISDGLCHLNLEGGCRKMMAGGSVRSAFPWSYC